jgi:hypothetical protein
LGFTTITAVDCTGYYNDARNFALKAMRRELFGKSLILFDISTL